MKSIFLSTYICRTPYRSMDISDVFLRLAHFTNVTYLEEKYTADVTGGKPVTV
jgi:rhodanese-related sulfurtransferase